VAASLEKASGEVQQALESSPDFLQKPCDAMFKAVRIALAKSQKKLKSNVF
jgi:hypothetical protein